MDVKPKTELRSVWIAVSFSILVGAGVWEGIEQITGIEAWDHVAYWWFGYPLMITSAGALGFSFPFRPWRWGLLIVVTQLIWAFVGVMGQAILLPFALLIFLILGIPCVLASHLGAWISRKLR